MKTHDTSIRLARLIFKVLALYLLANLVCAAAGSPGLGSWSLYNRLVPGRERLPYGENPAAYNLSLSDLDAMLASHRIAAAPKPADEFRIVVIGDSSVWGYLLDPEDTLAGNLDRMGIETPDGKRVRVYNLGYPTLSLTKDLLILQAALGYEPDLVLWMTTLEAFPKSRQLESAIVADNPGRTKTLIGDFGLDLDPADPRFNPDGFWDRTIVASRSSFANQFRLQLHGLMWAATGIDQFIPADPGRRAEDLEASEEFHGLPAPLSEADLAFDVLEAGLALAGEIPVLVVNQPIFISAGANSDLRYNFYYPRWAFDQYRAMMADWAEANGVQILDLWDAIPGEEFTNTALHLSPAGSELLAGLVAAEIRNWFVSPELAMRSDEVTSAAAPAAAETTREPGPRDAHVPLPAASPASPVPGLPSATIPLPSANPTSVPRLPSPPPAWRDWPVLPAFSPEMTALLQAAAANGLDPHAFSVIGDCQSVPIAFLGAFEERPEFWPAGDYSGLEPIIAHFAGSFGRRSEAVANGMGVASALSPWWADPAVCKIGETPIDCEFRLHRPAVVFINLGTNYGDLRLHAELLGRVVDAVLAHGAVPVLATKADNAEGDWSVNAAIAEVAADRGVPLWNVWRLMQELPDGGLLADHENGNYLSRAAVHARALGGLEVLRLVWMAIGGKP